MKGSAKGAAAPHVAGNGRHGKDATRKSTREAVKSDKAGRGRDVKNDAKGKGAKETGADAAAEAPTSARPKLPRPEGVAPCPRCHSEETKFCYYNNYNIKQPRYFCRGCQRYWTAGGMLRNVPVGAGRRKNKNGSTAAAATEDEDGAAATLAGRILAGVGTGARGQLSGLARAAAGMKSERRDGSSDGSVTEADGDDARIPAASAVPGFGWFGTPSQFSRATSGMGAGSSGEGVADGVAANAPADFGSMLGSMMANPFLAVQAAQAMHAGGWTGVNHDAMSAAAAQMAMYAQAQAAAAAGGGADASGTRAPPRKPTPPRKRSRRRGEGTTLSSAEAPFREPRTEPRRTNRRRRRSPRFLRISRCNSRADSRCLSRETRRLARRRRRPPRSPPPPPPTRWRPSRRRRRHQAPPKEPPRPPTQARLSRAPPPQRRCPGLVSFPPPRGLAARLRPTGRRCSR